MSRASTAQQDPDPSTDFATFPKTRSAAGTVLHRAARLGPWWFCACGDCRFDLTSPLGTCYLGTDELAGLLESIGLEWVSGGVLTHAFVTARTIYPWQAPKSTPLANLVSRRALEYKVSNEPSDMNPYRIPQEYAARLAAVRNRAGQVFAGIRYRTRFDTGAVARGVALFGPEGEADWPVPRGRPVDDKLLAQLAELGVVVQAPPTLEELELAEEV